MHYKDLVEQLGTQYRALRAAAVHAGPRARMPTCPAWVIPDLLAHLGKVYGWVPRLIGADERAAMPEPPTGWDELLPWADTQLDGLVHVLADTDPGTAAWFFTPDAAATTATWARRMAHETAIHRLDAEHAMVGDTEPVPGLLFDPEFAADGIDELLAFLVPLPHRAKREQTAQGSLLFQATDAGRAWEVVLTAGHEPVCRPAESTAGRADAAMSGTADAVFRAVWKRPSTAVLTGDTELFDSVPTP